jgi:hypothetical protein
MSDNTAAPSQWLNWFPQMTGADFAYPLGGDLMRAVRKARPNEARREWSFDLSVQPAHDGRMGWLYP